MDAKTQRQNAMAHSPAHYLRFWLADNESNGTKNLFAKDSSDTFTTRDFPILIRELKNLNSQRTEGSKLESNLTLEKI